MPVHIVCPHCSTTIRVPDERLSDAPRCGKCHEPLFVGKPVELSGADFDQHLQRSDVPIVVDFWAPWCGPCVMMAPHYESAAGRLEPGYRLAKLNTEDVPQIAARYGIRSIPTMIVFRGGQEVARHSGAIGAEQIVQWVRSHAPVETTNR
ncbi:MAG TPA: thioredoxin TrxC [Steroidobacteraceae bacterium]|nr:thioredoxin TrxC [Steroidobacteraceae bacterium]